MGVLIQSSSLAAVAAPGTGLQCSCPGPSRYFILIAAVYLDLHPSHIEKQELNVNDGGKLHAH